MHQPGTILGNYEVVSHVASGMTSEVYRARHRVLQSEHAIKVLAEPLAENEAFRDRFLRCVPPPVLRHPHIVPVTNVLAEPDLLALVMDRVEGPSLAHVMDTERPGPWTLRDAMAVMSPVLGGLAYAHAQGLFHGDLRPDHVLLEGAGDGGWKPRVTGFGGLALAAARAGHGASRPSPYWAPELAGEGPEGTAAADVYGLGTMLWRLLAGRLPTSPPSEPLPGAPQEMLVALRQALSPDPAVRQPDARALLKELTRAAAEDERQAPASPPGPPPPGPPPPAAPSERTTALEEPGRRGLASEPLAPPGFAPPPAAQTSPPTPAPQASPPPPVPHESIPPPAPQGPVGTTPTPARRRTPVLLLVVTIGGLFVLALIGIGIGAVVLLEDRGSSEGEGEGDTAVAPEAPDGAARAAELTAGARDGLEAYKTRNVDGRAQALQDALDAVALHDSADSRGLAALLQIYDRKLSSSNVGRCGESAPGLVELERVTRDVAAADEVSDEGYFARALWAFRHCQCNSGETRSSIPDTCVEASERFEQAYAQISGAPDRNWFRFEVIWQWQMHEMILGNIHRKAGDERRGRQILQASLDLCARGEGYKADAPVNDVELYKNCARSAIPLEMWDEMSRYNVRLADFEPGENGRIRAGPLSALSRLASHRDEACNEIPCYAEPSFETKDASTWLNGYPKPRRGHDAHHFCIGWAYAQLGCYREARDQLDDYLDSGHSTHRSEARALDSEIRGKSEACKVPGI